MAAICVYCASSERIEQRYVDLAADVGAALARRGHSLISGGGSVSCMGALARAARTAGARTVGVIPKALMALEVADGEADELVVAFDMRERKGEMERRADAFLALPGGIGTLEELFEIWVARSLGMHEKPLVVLDPDGVFDLLRAQVDDLITRGFARPTIREAIEWTASVDAAFDALETRLPTLRPTVQEVLEAEP
jgi:uncharacterized protein (TIGR00730 family)